MATSTTAGLILFYSAVPVRVSFNGEGTRHVSFVLFTHLSTHPTPRLVCATRFNVRGPVGTNRCHVQRYVPTYRLLSVNKRYFIPASDGLVTA